MKICDNLVRQDLELFGVAVARSSQKEVLCSGAKVLKTTNVE